MRLHLAFALIFLASLSACGDQDAEKQKEPSQANGPVISTFGPGQMSEDVAATLDDIERLDALYREALPLLENWLPGKREQGLELLRAAVAEGYAPAMAELGRQILNYSDLMPESEEQGLRLTKMAADLGVPKAQFGWGFKLLEAGRRDEGLRYMKKAAEQDVGVQGQYGVWLMENAENPQEKKRGLQLLKQAASVGDADALYNMGGVYLFSDQVNRDENKAHEYFLMAAKAGNLEASWNYAIAIFRREKTPALRREAWGYLIASVGAETGSGAFFYGAFISSQKCRNLHGLGAAWMKWGMNIAEKTKSPPGQLASLTAMAIDQLTSEQHEIYLNEMKRDHPSFLNQDFQEIDCK